MLWKSFYICFCFLFFSDCAVATRLTVRAFLFSFIEFEAEAMALGILTQFLRGGRAVPRTGIKILTSKRGPRNYYKGKGCKSTGRHTSKGIVTRICFRLSLRETVMRLLSNVALMTYVVQRELSGAGGYVLMDEKLPKYIVPDLTNCKVCCLSLVV